MNNISNIRLLGYFHQCAYALQYHEKKRAQGRILVLLQDHKKLTQRELIELTGRRSATLSEQLNGLEKAGLILRTRSGLDRRNVDVVLTEKGECAADRARAIRTQAADELFGSLTDENKRHLAQILRLLLIEWDVPLCENEYNEGKI